MIAKIKNILKNLEFQKQYYLDSLFPKEGQSIPSLRFKGFSEEWKENTIGKIFDIHGGRQIKDIDVTFAIPYINIPDMDMLENKIYIKTSSMFCNSTKTYNEGIIFATTGESIKKNRNRVIEIPACFNSTISIIIKKENIELSYLFFHYLLQNIDLGSFLKGSLNPPSFDKDSFLEYHFSLPSIIEQQVIANFLSKLDGLIEREREQLKNMEQQKQYYLDNLFPKEGQSVPSLRFKGFKGAWKMKILYDIKHEHGNRIITKERQSGNLPLVTAGFQNEGIADYITKPNKNKIYNNCLTIDMFGNIFIRRYDFVCDDNIYPFFGPIDYLYCLYGFLSTKLHFNYSVQFREHQMKELNIFSPNNTNEQKRITSFLMEVCE